MAATGIPAAAGRPSLWGDDVTALAFLPSPAPLRPEGAPQAFAAFFASELLRRAMPAESPFYGHGLAASIYGDLFAQAVAARVASGLDLGLRQVFSAVLPQGKA
ncbi:MAG: hypothetical protein IRY95_01775 [Clostridia bacterium]|nr:hypothetical protein [Clostridia bacterium]